MPKERQEQIILQLSIFSKELVTALNHSLKKERENEALRSSFAGDAPQSITMQQIIVAHCCRGEGVDIVIPRRGIHNKPKKPSKRSPANRLVKK